MKSFLQSTIGGSGQRLLGGAMLCFLCLPQAYAQPDYSEIARLSTRISQNRSDVSAIAARAGHWTAAGMATLALKDYDEAIRLAPTKSEYRSSRAVVYLSLKNYSMATNDCGVALNLDARNVPAYRTLAQTLLQQGQVARALGYLNTALTIKPNDARLWRLRSHANGADGNIKAAVADLEAAVAYDPSNAQVWNDLGRFRHLDNDLASALKAYENSYSIDPTLLETNLGLGRVHLELKNVASARGAFDRVSAMKVPGKPSLNAEYARVSEISGDGSMATSNWADAIRHYRASFDRQPNPAVERKLAEAYSNQLRNLLINSGNNVGAVSLCNEATGVLPGYRGTIRQKFAGAWVEWANADAATTEPQFIAARERLITSLSYHQDTGVQHKLVETLVRMMKHYAPLPNRRKEAGLVYADALRYATGDRTLTDWVVAKWKALNL